MKKTQEEVKNVEPKTIADRIWLDIKDIRLEIFSLPDQYVNMFCEPIKIEPSRLYLKSSAPALLTALELAVKGKYLVERLERYIRVSPIEQKPIE